MAQTLAQPEVETTTEKSPVQIRKLGHVVLWVSDVRRSAKFYTEILNFRVSDWDERDMVFLNACGDHHTIALFSRSCGEMPPPENLSLTQCTMAIATRDQ